MSSRERVLIRINDCPVVEADYSCLHFNLLYALAGMRLERDAYDFLPMERRDIAKKIANIALNAENMREAVFAIRSFIQEGGSNLSPERALTEFMKRHKPIETYFFTGVGLKLQFKDSQLADALLTTFTSKQIPILCVHDSFIVPSYAEKELVNNMLEEYRHITGGFEINVKVKRPSPQNCKSFETGGIAENSYRPISNPCRGG